MLAKYIDNIISNGLMAEQRFLKSNRTWTGLKNSFSNPNWTESNQI